jgi:hypothetical protein
MNQNVEAYDPRANMWACSVGNKTTTGCASATLAPLPGARTLPSAATGADGRLYVIGGSPDGVVPTSCGDAYDVGTNPWATVAPLSAVRMGLASVEALDGHLCAIGGEAGSALSASPTTDAMICRVERPPALRPTLRPPWRQQRQARPRRRLRPLRRRRQSAVEWWSKGAQILRLTSRM